MEEALIARLLADAPVAAIAGTRVYPGARPQGSALPAIVVNTISGAPVYDDQGEAGLFSARVQVDAWATTYTAAKLLARAVKNCLSGFVGDQGAIAFRNVLVEVERDLRETGSNESQYEFRTGIDFIVWFKEN